MSFIEPQKQELNSQTVSEGSSFLEKKGSLSKFFLEDHQSCLVVLHKVHTLYDIEIGVSVVVVIEADSKVVSQHL